LQQTIEMGFYNTIQFIARHPLNKGHQVQAFGRFARWQLSSRLANKPAVVRFVNETSFEASRSMCGLTQNIYCGLQELMEMAFTLHLLRPGDLFADVGANVGSYTLLAGGAAKADVIAFEPSPKTFEHLERNIALNGIAGARAVKAAVGSETGSILFTTGLDTQNHVLKGGEQADAESVPVTTLDIALANRNPILIKVDTEGFEEEVIRGGLNILRNPQTKCLIVELFELASTYGHAEKPVLGELASLGFKPFTYDPFQRTLEQVPKVEDSGNVILVRDEKWVTERLASAPKYFVANTGSWI
jgi:FkbM family methyltransferase